MRKIPTKWTRLQNQNSTLSSSAKIVHHKSRNGNIREKKLSLLTRPRAAGKKWKMSRDIFFVSVQHISHSLSVSLIATSFTSANNTQPLAIFLCVLSLTSHRSFTPSKPVDTSMSNIYFLSLSCRLKNYSEKKPHSRFISTKFSTHYTKFNGLLAAAKGKSGEKRELWNKNEKNIFRSSENEFIIILNFDFSLSAILSQSIRHHIVFTISWGIYECSDFKFHIFFVPFHSNSDGHRVQERRRRDEQRFFVVIIVVFVIVSRSQLLIFHMKNHYLTEVILVPSAQCLISHSHILIRFTFMANVESWLVWSCCLNDGRGR